MSLRRRFCSSVRPSLHRLLLTASLALAVAGCGDPGDEGPCTEAQGTLSGTIWYSAKDSGMVIPFGTVELALEPIDYPNSTLLSFKADHTASSASPRSGHVGGRVDMALSKESTAG